MKHILFAGPLWKGSTSVPRLKGLQELGLDVVTLDTTPWVGDGPKLLRSLNHRFYFGASVRAMNEALLRIGKEYSPAIVWIEKGTWVYPSTLRQMRERARFLVHYNTDDVFARGAYFWLHRLGLRSYDLYLTTNRYNAKEIQQRYGVRTLRVGMGYDSDFYCPPSLDSFEILSEAVFVGHWQPHTERYIMALLNSGVHVQVWGYNWWKAKVHALRATKHLPYTDYARTIGRAKIALCFLSRRNRNESTGRSFEIPAIGTFMLAERTAEHEFLYGDGVGAALFSSEKELVDKACYYLKHSEKRQAIAATGHARCQVLGLSWADHIRREWPIQIRMLNDGEFTFRPEDDNPFWKGFRQGEAWKRI